MKRFIGCHLSTTGGFVATVRTAQSIGANTFAFLPAIHGAVKQKQKTPQMQLLPWNC